MKTSILIIGSTGKLGSILINYCGKNSIKINAISCYSNTKKLSKQKKLYEIPNSFCMSIENEKFQFLNYIKKNIFNIVYFLDCGPESIEIINKLINYNKKCYFAIANKELIIAGGQILQNKIKRTSNYFIPLDSEHFSLNKSNLDRNLINKIFITASGGPFYSKKKIKLKI